MGCFHPLEGWRSATPNPNGKRSIVFRQAHAYSDRPDLRVQLPCGRCIGCRLEKSRQWAMRCMHEASLHEHNSFITLTYDEDHLPPDGSLDVRHFQQFMKNLRYHFPQKIRYYHCGEYGEEYSRPHYHACLFGLDFPDKKLWKESEMGSLYVSEKLTKIWGFGHCLVGAVTFESAAYVARYITKKLTGDRAEEYGGRQPEYATMSRRGGIGAGWFERWKDNVYPRDTVIFQGREMQPPKAYDRYLELAEKDLLDYVKEIRKKKHPDRLDPEFGTRRMEQKRKCKVLTLQSIKRSYENK
jgi:hypothetical protein